MAINVEMPKFGLSMEEGTIVSWLKNQGDVIKKGDEIAEVSTEKITNIVEAPADGILVKIIAEVDETVLCGETIAIIAEAGEEINDNCPVIEETAENQDNSAITAVEMPKFGLSMEEGTIVAWLKNEGDAVKKGEEIAEVSTEKITNIVEAPASGILRKIMAEVDETVICGEPIALIADASTDISSFGQSKEAVNSDTSTVSIRKEPAITEAQVATTMVKRDLSEIRITPKAEKMAKEKGIDYSSIIGTGILEAITIADLKNFIVAGGNNVVMTSSPLTEIADKKMSQMQITIAKRMQESLAVAAQATISTDADVTNLVSLYKENKEDYNNSGIKLTYTAIIIKAVALALEKHPKIRTILVDGNVLRTVSSINIGVAVDIEDGLVVPVLKNVNQKDLRTISQELADLAERARNNQLTLDEMSGGTITITNLGMFGIKYFTPVLNLPESAILGIGALTEQLMIKDGGIFTNSIMNMSLTHDHRIIDGAPAARFLNEIKAILNDFKEFI